MRADPGSLRDQAVRGVAWSVVEKWSVRASSLVGFILLGRLLGPTAFGVVALAMAFISILQTVADAGFAGYVVRARHLASTTASTAFWTTVTMATVLSGGLAALSRPIAGWLDTPQLASVMPALALSLFVYGLSSVQIALMRRELRFKELAVRQVSATVVSVVVSVTLAFAGAGVWALVAQYLVRNAVALVVLWRTSDFRPRWTYDRVEARAMTRYGVLSMGSSLSTALRSQGETFLIGALAGPVALGSWVVASRIVDVIVSTLTSVISTVATPVFARLQNDTQRLARALGTTSSTSAFVVVPTLVALSLTSTEVVPAVFGQKWGFAATLAAVMALRSLLRTLTNPNGSVLLATGHPGVEAAINGTTMVVQLGLTAWLYRDLTLLAAALSATVALTIPVRALMVRRLVGIPLTAARGVASVLLAAGTAAGVVLAVAALADLSGLAHVALVVGLGGAVYLGMIALAGRPVVRQVLTAVRPVLRERGPRLPRWVLGG